MSDNWATMPPKLQPIVADEMINALQDETVLKLLGSIFEHKLADLLKEFNAIKLENTSLRQQLAAAEIKIDGLEAYNRKSNLIISGLPLHAFAEASSQPSRTDDLQPASLSEELENSVLELINTQLQVKVSTYDISIVHRLRVKKSNKGPPPVIIRFTNMKTRDAVYKARRSLKTYEHKVFVNEDLTKHTLSPS